MTVSNCLKSAPNFLEGGFDYNIREKGLLDTGLGVASIVPLIFFINADAVPGRGNGISGLVVKAIIGGAIVQVLDGSAADLFGLAAGYIVSGFAAVGILFTTFRTSTS